ncbi:four-helix bundle copper-binding protein [Proteinivorax tanatarense]|uniref:Four-helix bundle copper-binding protein n=2 Tax=Proteinivorax tanatarense TaxID=1260629 RepID=A0AAU7VRR7_9FIRM
MECFDACLDEPDVSSRKKMLGLLVECAMTAQNSITLMAMNGQLTKEHCELCAKICDMCADECAKFEEQHCQNCADVCHVCANECRQMANEM